MNDDSVYIRERLNGIRTVQETWRVQAVNCMSWKKNEFAR